MSAYSVVCTIFLKNRLLLMLMKRQGTEYIVHLLVSHKVMDPSICTGVPKSWDAVFPSELLPIDGCEDRLTFFKLSLVFCRLTDII